MPAATTYVAILLLLGSTLSGHGPAPFPPPQAESADPRSHSVPIENGDLEATMDSAGRIPSRIPGWLVPQPLVGAGYRLRVSEREPHGGRACAELYSDPAAWTSLPGVGSMVQDLEAISLRDQTVRLSGWVRTEGAGGAQLWLRVDDASGPPRFFEYEPAEPFHGRKWTRFEIVGAVTYAADRIRFGVNLVGQGSVFADDVRLEVVDPIGHQSPAPVSPRGLENLIAAARLFDVLRFFHPSDSCSAAPWDRLSVALVATAEPATDAGALAAILAQFAAPIAPSVMIFPTGDDRERQRIREEVALRFEGHRPIALVEWSHYGIGHRDVGFPERESVYRSWRSVVEGADLSLYPNPGRAVELELGGGVSAIVPTAVYIDESHGSLPPSPRGIDAIAGKPEGFEPSTNDRTTRLAGILYCWSILREFYPNFDLASCSEWESTLRQTLSKTALDHDRDAFVWTLREMLACLGDGHAEVHVFYPERPGKLPLIWRWIEDRLVVTEVAGSIRRADGSLFEPGEVLAAGDLILAVDGRSTPDVLDSLGVYVSSPTERWRRYRAIGRLGSGTIGTKLHLTIERESERFELEVPLFPREQVDEALPSKQLDPVRTLAEGIVYADLSRLDDRRLEQVLSQAVDAQGIVFDLRGDPDLISPPFLGHWIDAVVLSPEWKVRLLHEPMPSEWIRSERSLEPEVRSTRWALDPIAPRLQARIAFLMDERSISRAETYLSVARSGLGGILVGTPSAGTLGNANRARLPGGLRITWTGMDVFEGTATPEEPNQRLSGIGIMPTLMAAPTLAGAREGRDEVLERAVAAVSG